MALGDGGDPDCTVADEIGQGTAFAKELFARLLDAGDGLQFLRVGIVSRDNNSALPDGAQPLAVFSCRLEVVAASGVVELQHMAGGSTPAGADVGLQSAPGQISIE